MADELFAHQRHHFGDEALQVHDAFADGLSAEVKDQFMPPIATKERISPAMSSGLREKKLLPVPSRSEIVRQRNMPQR